MNKRKQVGKKSNYLCSGLVYCANCGAKMHGSSPTRKGHTYHYYSCSKKCGAPVANMHDVDTAALNYLHTLLTPANQRTIAIALRQYKSQTKVFEEDFKTAIKKKVKEKETQYNALLSNLSSGALPAEVVADIGQQMQSLKAEMKTLADAQPPKDYTNDQVSQWLQAIKDAPDSKAVYLLIDRIEVKNKIDISISSALTSILGEIGRGDRIRTCDLLVPNQTRYQAALHLDVEPMKGLEPLTCGLRNRCSTN